ncbi:MAG: DinB family protein, partial [Spirosomataceae bacterium]
MTLQTTLYRLFERDLTRLKVELNLYSDEQIIWQTTGQISNTAGNLTLHLLGNLNTYIGAVLGETGYVRDRPAEFSLKNIPRESLLEQIDALLIILQTTLEKLSDTAFEEEYPLLVFEEKTSTEYLLVHLTTHLTYHLGQIN